MNVARYYKGGLLLFALDRSRKLPSGFTILYRVRLFAGGRNPLVLLAIVKSHFYTSLVYEFAKLRCR